VNTSSGKGDVMSSDRAFGAAPHIHGQGVAPPPIKARRYPGAPPFEDTPLAQQLFFGRPSEKVALANRIMANRLVVFYGRSGLGKTSLLNAGVAPLLRDEGFFPIWVRFNMPEQDPIRSVFDAVQRSTAQQGVECIPALTNSLWHYFKTTQLWRGDVLLTPVLILDQFEEVFTLLQAEQRDVLVAALGFLIRGVQPPSSDLCGTASMPADDPPVRLSEKPPAVAVVIAIREDFLGSLEELSGRIPQVLDQRFRLMPLDRACARQAIEAPASIEALGLMTRPFQFEAAAIESILNFLSRRSESAQHVGAVHIEPFQLQLVCQWIEEKIADKSEVHPQQALTVTATDVGGENNLQSIMQTFYGRQLQGFPWRVRRALRRLCEERLISRERRRLSLDEEEILRSSRINAGTLARLVDGRLLRVDRRAGGSYYELSHDTLIAPILERGRVLSLLRGGVQVATGGLMVLLGILGLFFPVYGLAFVVEKFWLGEAWKGDDVGLAFMAGIVPLLYLPFLIVGRVAWGRGWDLIHQRSGGLSIRMRRRFYRGLAVVLGLLLATCLVGAGATSWDKIRERWIFFLVLFFILSIASGFGVRAAWRRSQQLSPSEVRILG
jgi:hypothetical protein